MAKIIKFFLLFSFVFFSGCNPTRRAERLVDKAERVSPGVVIKKAGELIPANIEIKIIRDTIREKELKRTIETIVRAADSIIKIDPGNDCEKIRKQLNEANQFIGGLQNTLNNIPIITDTVIKIDTHKLLISENQNKLITNKLIKEKTKHSRDLLISLLGILIITLAFIYLLFRKK